MLPMKNWRRRPARVSSNRRVLTWVVEPNPATSLVVSRSITRMTASSDSSLRSRSCRMIPRRLFPVIEHLLSPAVGLLLALADFGFDVRPPPSPPRPAAVVQVGIVAARIGDIGHEHF